MTASPTPPAPKQPLRTSAWSPFAHRAFTMLWSATVVSNVGMWTNDVGAGWLMATLSPSPLLVASVQAAATLPVFLFALPAGALADIMDRRRLLIILNVLGAIVAAAFALLVMAGAANVWLVLAFTFLLGTGLAFNAPAWQAIVPQLVPRKDLPSAIALNSIGINISRAIGPAFAGFLIAWLGLASPFVLNAVSFLAIIAALLLWRPPERAEARLPAERMGAAIRTGLRYARWSSPLTATLVRTVGFILFASAYWGLLPLVAKTVLNGGPELYGILLGAVGAGAIAGAFALPWLRRRLGINGVVAVGTLGTSSVLAVLGLLHYPAAGIAACAVAGACWTGVLSSLHVSAQMALPDWVRARGLSIFLSVMFGSMGFGSILWGRVAEVIGIAPALMAAGAGAALAIPLTWRWRLNQGDALDLAPSMHWPEPVLSPGLDRERGPLMVTVEYEIDPDDTGPFLAAAGELAKFRRLDGAYEWGILEDIETPGLWLEYFLVDNLIEHMRQHERVSQAARRAQIAVYAFHKGGKRPVVRHLAGPARG